MFEVAQLANLIPQVSPLLLAPPQHPAVPRRTLRIQKRHWHGSQVLLDSKMSQSWRSSALSTEPSLGSTQLSNSNPHLFVCRRLCRSRTMVKGRREIQRGLVKGSRLQSECVAHELFHGILDQTRDLSAADLDLLQGTLQHVERETIVELHEDYLFVPVMTR
jgi:hypothetical protein